jgi:hypothetical protein
MGLILTAFCTMLRKLAFLDSFGIVFVFLFSGRKAMTFEHHKKPLLSRREFARRQLRHVGFSFLILTFSIGLGTTGYHTLGALPWIDSFLNASMILTGMGPVDRMETIAGKLFSSFYALFSGIAFLTFVGVLFAPMYHRFLHKLHLDIEEKSR